MAAAYIGTRVQGLFTNRPSRSATRFKPKRNATVRPRKVCSPYKGEKEKNTPTAKAMAIRSGGSSRAKRRFRKFVKVRSNMSHKKNRNTLQASGRAHATCTQEMTN